MANTAAALIIGNEVLTGKVSEQNIHLLAKELFALGVALERIVICRDVIDVIARDLNDLRATHDLVITTGGVGPTHDDVTMKAVAKAFGVGIVRSPVYEKMLRDYHGERTTEMHLRMADVPDGCRLATTPEMSWPTVVMGNVYVFPGVPQIFKMKLGLLRQELAGSGRFHSHALYLDVDEASVAELLDRLSTEYADVSIGSYLFWGAGADYKTKLTIDGRDQGRVDACFRDMLAGVEPRLVVRTD